MSKAENLPYGYSDSDFAGDTSNPKSTLGHVLVLNSRDSLTQP